MLWLILFILNVLKKLIHFTNGFLQVYVHCTVIKRTVCRNWMHLKIFPLWRENFTLETLFAAFIAFKSSGFLFFRQINLILILARANLILAFAQIADPTDKEKHLYYNRNVPLSKAHISKHYFIIYYIFCIASCAIWWWSMVYYIKGGIQAKGIRKKGSWGEYLGPRGMIMGSREGSTMRNFIVCTVHLI